MVATFEDVPAAFLERAARKLGVSSRPHRQVKVHIKAKSVDPGHVELELIVVGIVGDQVAHWCTRGVKSGLVGLWTVAALPGAVGGLGVALLRRGMWLLMLLASVALLLRLLTPRPMLWWLLWRLRLIGWLLGLSRCAGCVDYLDAAG